MSEQNIRVLTKRSLESCWRADVACLASVVMANFPATVVHELASGDYFASLV